MYFATIKLVMYMKKNIETIIVCIAVGFLMGQFMFNQYHKEEKPSTIPTIQLEEKLYFLQQGVYSNLDTLKQNLTDFEYYTYTEKDGKYYVYVAIIKSKENMEKLKGYFNQKGYDIYVKEISVTSTAFLEVLDQYEQLLNGTEDAKTIEAACSQILAKYEELVVNDKN